MLRKTKQTLVQNKLDIEELGRDAMELEQKVNVARREELAVMRQDKHQHRHNRRGKADRSRKGRAHDSSHRSREGADQNIDRSHQRDQSRDMYRKDGITHDEPDSVSDTQSESDADYFVGDKSGGSGDASEDQDTLINADVGGEGGELRSVIPDLGVVKHFSKAMLNRERNTGVYNEVDKQIDAFLAGLIQP